MNIIVSFVVTLINLFISVLSFLKGPLLIGALVGVSIMVFASNAEAAVYAPYQCNNSACPVFAGMSFSELFGLCSILVGIAITAYLYSDSKKGN